jgi:hypothetical protein
MYPSKSLDIGLQKKIQTHGSAQLGLELNWLELIWHHLNWLELIWLGS